MCIPLWAFTAYWIAWFTVSAYCIYDDLGAMMWPLIIAFIAVETLGILFTVKDAGTLTDTTGKYVPEDFTFILIALMLWRLSQWMAPHVWVVWGLGGWLAQHFIVHYQQFHEEDGERPRGGWRAPHKLRKWIKGS